MKLEFSEPFRKTLARARSAAAERRQAHVGTEHLLLALLHVADPSALRVLEEHDGSLDDLRRMADDAAPHGPGRPARASGELPYSDRAKRVIELAMDEVRDARESLANCGHLFVALLRAEDSVAAAVLRRAGFTVDRARGALASRDSAESAPILRVEIDDASDRSIYEQIVAQVKEQIATGALRPGERLPPVRRLADQLDVAPGTVARAYAELERLGLVVTEGARGTRVASRSRVATPASQRTEMLIGLLRPVAVAAFHLGASAEDLRTALQEAMRDIYGDGGSAAA